MSDFIIYLISYALVLIAGTVILRVLVRREYLKKGVLRPFSAFLQGALFFTYGGFPVIYLDHDWPSTSLPSWLHAVGLGLLLVGLCVLLYGMLKLGITRSIGRGELELERSGLYQITRNPQAVACGIYVIGFGLLWPSWYALGWVLLYFILIHLMVLTEEENLRKRHGEQYEEYLKRVPRYLGNVLRTKTWL